MQLYERHQNWNSSWIQSLKSGSGFRWNWKKRKLEQNAYFRALCERNVIPW